MVYPPYQCCSCTLHICIHRSMLFSSIHEYVIWYLLFLYMDSLYVLAIWTYLGALKLSMLWLWHMSYPCSGNPPRIVLWFFFLMSYMRIIEDDQCLDFGYLLYMQVHWIYIYIYVFTTYFLYMLASKYIDAFYACFLYMLT